MADVFSIRGTEEQRKKFDQIADGYKNKSDAFAALLAAYEESQTITSGESRVVLEYVRGLCDTLYQAYYNLMAGQSAEIDNARKEYTRKLEEQNVAIEEKEKKLNKVEKKCELLEADLEQARTEIKNLNELNKSLQSQLDAAQSVQESLATMQKLLADGTKGRKKE